MKISVNPRARFAATCTATLAGLAIAAAPGACAAAFPDKPITMYVAFAAGGTTDITARALAQGIEKRLGVPVAVENKGGGGATVANSLLASKKPDGYSLLATSTGSITVRPLLVKLAYTATSFRVLMQYTLYVGSLTVRTDAPWKNINEFIDYAQKNPGLTYSSSGPHTQQQVAVESFAMCKNLKFKHVPTKGGSTANTALLGGHVDFVAGSGSHLPLVEQGAFRELLIFHRDERGRPDHEGHWLSAHEPGQRHDRGGPRRPARRHRRKAQRCAAADSSVTRVQATARKVQPPVCL